jgi:hypothetical protein
MTGDARTIVYATLNLVMSYTIPPPFVLGAL